MKIIDTRNQQLYSPLIPAIVAFCHAASGEKLKVIMKDEHAFYDFKEFLVEQAIGFREVYDGEEMSVEFTKTI